MKRVKGHDNLFSSHGTKAEVYERFQKAYVEEQRYFDRCKIAIGIIVALTIFFDQPTARYFLSAAGVLCISQALIYYIELSNLNCLMHSIDWFEFKEKAN